MQVKVMESSRDLCILRNEIFQIYLFKQSHFLVILQRMLVETLLKQNNLIHAQLLRILLHNLATNIFCYLKSLDQSLMPKSLSENKDFSVAKGVLHPCRLPYKTSAFLLESDSQEHLFDPFLGSFFQSVVKSRK